MSIWGPFFFTEKRWFSHMNENETFCVEKQPKVCLGWLAAFSEVLVLFGEKMFLLVSVQSNNEISCF